MRQQIVPPPEGFDPKGAVKRGMAWCPYCGRIREFGWDAAVEAARCAGCGISNRDFWVRRFNGLLQDGPMVAFERAVVRSGRVKDTPVFPWEKAVAGAAGFLIPEEEGKARACMLCGQEFVPTSPRQKYCSSCQVEKRREWWRENARRRRAAS